MNLATPLGLAAAGLAVPLVIFYVLRSRRPRQVVASTFLWNRTDRSVAAAIPWQKFRPDVTFWLILLALLLGSLALARPFRNVPAELGDHTILVLDASGSMLADEGGPTRLELARREARSLVDRLSPGQEISVVEAGTTARVLLSASADPVAIRRALDAVRPTHGAADLVDAFTLAAALERPGQSTLVHLMTDGVVSPVATSAAPAGLIVTAVGESRPNLAVTRLQAVPIGAGTNQVFVQARNLGPLPSRGRLTLAVSGTDVLEQTLDLGPRASEDLVLEVSGGDGDVLVARIEPIGNDLLGNPNADALSIDDRAYALLAAPRELDVTIAGPGNVFLEAAFRAVPGVTVTTVAVVPGDLRDVDLLVVDRVPSPPTPTVPTLLVAPTILPVGLTTSGDVERPAITFQAPNHELLIDVDLSEVAIATARVVEAPALTTIAGGSKAALMVAGRLDGVPTVMLNFNLLESNLPLLPAWPVFVGNAVTWLAGAPVPASATAGDLVTVQPPVGATGVLVSPPSGDAIRLDVATPRIDVNQVGLWRLAAEGLAEDVRSSLPDGIAVNPDPAESDLSREQPDPVERRDDLNDNVVASVGRDEFGRDMLAIVLFLAALEWAWAFGIAPWRRRRKAAKRAAAGMVVDGPAANAPPGETREPVAVGAEKKDV